MHLDVTPPSTSVFPLYTYPSNFIKPEYGEDYPASKALKDILFLEFLSERINPIVDFCYSSNITSSDKKLYFEDAITRYPQYFYTQSDNVPEVAYYPRFRDSNANFTSVAEANRVLEDVLLKYNSMNATYLPVDTSLPDAVMVLNDVDEEKGFSYNY